MDQKKGKGFPVDAVNPRGSSRVVHINEIIALTGMSKTTIYRAMQNHVEFPAGIKIGSRTGWLLDEVEAWLNARPRVSLRREE